MLFVQREQKLTYCRPRRDAIDANVKVAEGDLELKCWFFEKPYSNMYLMGGDTHRKRALEFEIRHRASVPSPIFVGWHNLKMLGVPPKDQHLHYVFVKDYIDRL